jgi:hypothetical protein
MTEFFVGEIMIKDSDFAYDLYRVAMLQKTSVPLVSSSGVSRGIQTDADGILHYFSCGLTS